MRKALFIAGAVLVASAANAQIAFTNFGAGDTFNTGSGYTIAGPNGTLGANYDQGDMFTAAFGGTVSTVRIAMGLVTGTGNGSLRLYADNGGTLGSQIGNTASYVTSGTFGNAYSPSVVNCAGLGWNIAQNGNYWLIADSNNDAWQAWNLNSIGDNGPHVFINNGSPQYGFQTRGTFEVNVVPEPATMAVLGLGLAAMARRRRK